MKSNQRQKAIAAGLGVLMLLAAGSLAWAGGVFALAQDKPQARPAPQEWISVNIVSVKPEKVTEWVQFQRNEIIPALKKAGIKWRAAWQAAVFSTSHDYALVTPIESFAQYDGENRILAALGQEAATALLNKSRQMITGSRTLAVRNRPDLSYLPETMEAPKLAVATFTSVTPGRQAQFEALIKNEVVPIMKKANVVGYSVSQTVFGGDANEYATFTFHDSFEDIGKGSPVSRVLGEAGAAKLLEKIAGLVRSAERHILRFNANLSYQ